MGRSGFHATLVLGSALLVNACGRGPAPGAEERSSAAGDSLVAAGGPIAASMELGGFGSLRGQLLPEGVEAVIHVTAEEDGRPAIDPTFSDPLSGSFAAEDLPAAVYRVEVQPLDPAYSARVFEDVVVPYDEVRDLGTVDLRRDSVGPRPR